jgi:hypothetical protein
MTIFKGFLLFSHPLLFGSYVYIDILQFYYLMIIIVNVIILFQFSLNLDYIFPVTANIPTMIDHINRAEAGITKRV